MDTTTAIEYYKDLLIAQFVQKTKARSSIGSLVDCSLCDGLALDINNAFDLETAVGHQLDVIGSYIGQSRTVTGQIARNYWALADYTTYNPSSPLTGLTDYVDPTVNQDSVTYRYQYASESTTDLTDDEYRYLLRFKLILNSTDMTLARIQSLIWDFMKGDVVAWDLADMTISYAISSTSGRFVEIVAAQDMMPKPVGVSLSGVFKVPDPMAVFGFQDYTVERGNTTGFSDYIAGSSGQHIISYNDKI